MTTTETPASATGTYAIDPSHTQLGFVARHAMVTKVRGSFNEIEGSGVFDAENPEASHFEVTIKAESIDTRNADRDAHLRSNDFFDMENNPTITFVSTAISKVADDTYHVDGDLTIRGVTNAIGFDLEMSGPARDAFGNVRIGLEGSTSVSRKDWNLNWNMPLDAGGVLVSEKVTLEFEVSAIQQAD